MSTRQYPTSLVGATSEYPGVALDGNVATCSRTGPDVSQPGQKYWHADLKEQTYVLGFVIKINTTDSGRFRGFSIHVGNSTTALKTCFRQGDHTDGELIMDVNCEQPVVGSVIRISLAENETSALVLCEIEIYGGRLVSFNRPTKLISTLEYKGFWNASYAVGGRSPLTNEDQDNATIRTCAASNNSENSREHWWTIDLTSPFSIIAVSFYGRLERGNLVTQFNNFVVKAGWNNNYKTIFTDLGSNDINDYQPRTKHLTWPVDGAIVRVERNGLILVVCELEIFADCPYELCGMECNERCMCKSQTTGTHKIFGTCPNGCAGRWTGLDKKCNIECLWNKWGPYCNETCNCEEGNACDVASGFCPGSCQPGWKPPQCGEVCSDGTYGINCTSTCGSCMDMSQCNKTSGHCASGCQPGYKQPHCIYKCDNITYGKDCAYKCGNCLNGEQCHHLNGTCPNGCRAGYESPYCNKTCSWGSYGLNCSGKCGYCKNQENCDHIEGICDNGCQPGFKTPFCYEKCDAGYYGDECNSKCGYCFNNKSCITVNGSCPEGCAAGYYTELCKHPCPSGRYGRNCNELCGHCLAVEQCNPANGYCSKGCQPGYNGDACKTECEDGKFGNDCSNFCHCQNDVACDKKTGLCSNGCDIMWTGDTCSEYQGFDLSHLKNSTSQIGTFNSNGADRAVDRVNNYSTDICACCSVAENKENVAKAWWQIDLGQKYLIDAVALFGLSDNSNQQQIKGAAVFAGNQSLSGNFSSGTLVYTVPSSIRDKYYFVHQLNLSIIARFFIVRINQTILTLCEFQLREKVCTVERFGENCSQQCHCKDGLRCDPVTGYCPNKECEPGWKGDACNAKCENQTFGYGCNYTCHRSSCEPADGTCHTQCYPGWKGSSCSQDSNLISLIKGNASTSMSSVYNDTWESYLAIDGNIGPNPALCKCCARTNNAAMSWWSIDLGLKYPISSITIFGRNEVPDIGQQLEGFQILLSNTSSFDQTIFFMDNSSHVSSAYSVEVHNQLARFIQVQRPGVLTLCEVLVQEGECPTGFFGTECSRTCKCLDNKPCSRRSGVCATPFCQLGYKGMSCDSECLPGTFGENCQERCFCANGDICTSDHGLCQGRCDLGYYGPQCNKAIAFDHTTQNLSSSAAASQGIQLSLVIGVSVGCFILVASVTCLIIFKIYRRHTQKRDKDNNTYMQSNLNAATNDADYDTLEVPQSEYINNRYVNDQTSAL